MSGERYVRCMSLLSAWDLDGTIRPGSLLGDAIAYGIQNGFIDPARYTDPSRPTYEDADTFIEHITGRHRHDFAGLMQQLGEEAREQTSPWALERLEAQAREGMVVVLSHSPDFLVKAFCYGLGIRTASGSYFHTRNYIFSGRTALLDKRRMLARHLREAGIDHLSFAAGDSIHDVPMLIRARHAVVVNPDEELTKLAQQSNWEIIRTDT